MADHAGSTPPQRSTGDPSGAKKTEWSDGERADWVQLAYQAGMESVKAQREELSAMRTRALAFTAFIATTTGFLVGAGLSADVVRDDGFYALTIAGSVCFAVLAILLVFAVAPFFQFKFILKPDDLMEWMEGSERAPSRTWALRALATDTVPAMIKMNERSLTWIRWLYRAILVFSLTTLTIWVAVVWMYR
ncbi:hypothetical protein ACTU3I_14550 [Microbacterium sp. RD1]|uniref:hypothetical protein n=1 Tax=Microbacterium sp. RD1 TaxID=3457313 RepID=UPI003FA5AD1D